MRIPFVDLKRQHLAIQQELETVALETLRSGWYVLGENVRAFEAEFAAYCGVRYGLGVGSGTEALHLALRACEIGPGDEVITVSHTAVATVAAIRQAGATPVLVDIHPTSLTLDPALLEPAITPRTKAVIPVHLYGQPADLDPILKVARRYGLRVIEDCAQAHGASYRGRRVGSWGDLGCFSFYPTKNLAACGDAGMIVTDDEKLAERVRLLRQYGWQDHYISQIEGINSRLDELQAALLRVKLRHLEEWNARRRELAQLYNALLSPVVVTPIASPETQPVYHLYVIRCSRRDELQAYLREQGIGTLVHYPVPVHLQPAYAFLGLGPGSLPESERAAREVLSLPLYPELTFTELEQVVAAVRAFSHLSERGMQP